MLAGLLSHLDPAIEVDLVLNREGETDVASHLHRLAAIPNIRLHSVDVGLPIDPTQTRPLAHRLLARATHHVRRQRVVRLTRETRPDVVYTSQQRFDCRLGEITAARLGLPQVVHLHYIAESQLRRTTLRRLVTCDRLIVISAYVGRSAIEHGTDPSRVVVISNAADPAPVGVPARRDQLVIGQVGRMSHEKGFTDTVQVFGRLVARHHGLGLLLVGNGPYRGEVDQALSSLPTSAKVRVVGWQTNVDPWLEQIDVFVHPSHHEPFGLAVLEAMAAGIPVVAYGDGGVGEIVVDGESGFLHEPGDIDGMATSVDRLLSDPALRRAMGAAARERVRTCFDPVQAGSRFSRVVFEVASSQDVNGEVERDS